MNTALYRITILAMVSGMTAVMTSSQATPHYALPYSYYRPVQAPGYVPYAIYNRYPYMRNRAYAYHQPAWYMHGYINRYGDYQLNFKFRNISYQDMYMAWLLFREYGGRY